MGYKMFFYRFALSRFEPNVSLIALIYFFLFLASARSQDLMYSKMAVINGGFELPEGRAQKLADHWKLGGTQDFDTFLDEKEVHTGKRSFKLSASNELTNTRVQTFEQTISLSIQSIQKISVLGFIKTHGVIGNSGLYAKLIDGKGKQILYTNLQIQAGNIIGDTEWNQYTLNLICDTNARALVIGGYLDGSGVAWFDDLELNTKYTALTIALPEVKQYVSRYLSIIKQNSIYTNELNWANIESNINLLTRYIYSLSEAQVLVEYILQKLRSEGDTHSFLQSPGWTEKLRMMGQPFPVSKILSPDIGYINIPRFTSEEVSVARKFASVLQECIRELDQKRNVDKWIIDLRENTGGGMYPAIAGLGPLLGNGPLGQFVGYKDGQIYHLSWSYSKGKAMLGKNVMAKVDNPYKNIQKKIKIALLVGPNTSSSGEMIAIAFIGKSGVTLIGQPTAGLISGNSAFPLLNGNILYLASAYTKDRLGKTYKKGIYPDFLSNSDEANIQNANDWFNR